MASWFTRTLDTLTPWNRGGEVQRRQERKKKEEERQQQNSRASQAPTLRVTTASPTQKVTVQNNLPKPQRPENLFQDLNKSLTISAPKNVLNVTKSQDTAPVEKPTPGTVVQPTLKVTNNPNNQRIKLPDGRYADEIPDTPERIIDRGLDAGKSWEQIARENNYRLDGVREYSKATRPNYGITIKKPNQSIGNKFRDIFDANTEADKYRRQQGNIEKGENKNLTLENPGNLISRTPIVGHVTKMVNTAGVQIPQVGLTAQQMFATKERSAAEEELRNAKASKDPVRIAAANRRVDGALQRLDNIQEDLNRVESFFKKNKGGWFNAGTLYDEEAAKRGDIKTAVTDIALPTAVTALDLYTLGKGSTISEALKQSGKAGLRSQGGNIAKMTAGNYLSGDLSARAEGATGWDPIKSGSINAVLGSAPDIGLPLIGRSFKNRVLPKIFKGRGVDPADVVDELDDAAISASAEAAIQATRPRPIKIAQNIPVKAPDDIATPIDVVRRPSGRPLIKELEGDFNFPTFEQLQQIRVDDMKKAADVANSTARPDPAVSGITPRTPEAPYTLSETAIKGSQDQLIDEYAAFLKDIGEGNGVDLVPDGELYGYGKKRVSNNVRFGDTKGKRMTKAMWREEAERQLRAGEAEPGIQQAFNDAADPELQALLAKGEQPDAPIGRPIQIKEAKGIPVRDETVVPTDLPETPGQVRVTEASSPNNAKSAAVAAQTPAPIKIPKVGTVLPDGTKVTKRMVESARNQRKNAKAYAKAQEEVTEQLERIKLNAKAKEEILTPDEMARREQLNSGFAPTGKFAKGKNKNMYEQASGEAEAARARPAVADKSADDLITELAGKEDFTQFDIKRMEEVRERLMKDPDYSKRDDFRVLDELYSSAGTKLGQGLSLFNRVLRRNATADRITNQWYNRVSKITDTSKISDADFEAVTRANDNFVQLRDTEARLNEQFLKTGSEKDFNAWQDAYKKAEQADIDAKTTELKAAKNASKGSKNENVAKVIADMEKEADLNMMDHVTASQLSGPATGTRNLIGTELAGVENRLFANTRAKVTKALFGENVGGYNRVTARGGRKEGIKKFFNDISRRSSYAGKNPLKHAQNWATSVNSMGEASLYSQARSRLGAYYKQQLKEAGYSGKDLDMRVAHAIAKDPEDMAGVFLDSSMKSSGLTGLYQKTQTIEKALSSIVEGWVGKAIPPKAAKSISKALTRLTVGYPTATANFIAQSSKRSAVGIPSFLEMGYKLARGDKQAAAMAFDRGLKEAGSGAAMWGAGMALNQAGLISGFYPEDENERQRWKDEGISELSIKIGDAWYPIPTQFGMLGLPILFGATYNEGGVDEVVDKFANRENLWKLLPADQAYGVAQVLAGDSTTNQDKSFVASAIRSMIPAGSLLAQTAKGTDPTANDTTTKDFWSNVMDQVITGLPVINNRSDIPDQVSSTGVPIKNPNLLQVYSGARSVEQQAGVENSREVDAQISEALANLDQYGLLTDPNMDGVLDGSALEAYEKANTGKKLDESDIKALKEGLVKGVSSEGTDTAYLERGEYDTNLAVLKLKRDMMQADKTTKPSSLKDVETAIKRGEVYKEAQVPYEMIDAYQNTGVEDWRKMGDPESDDYDPERYQQLWVIDELMTKAGVSYRKGALDKQKYYAKEGRSGSGSRSGSRSGGSRSDNFSPEFGKLKTGDFAPSVQAYQTIDQKSGTVPMIRTVRPNIVHKIGSSG